ncbi:FDLD family class I lanthipeptide [Tumebacillus algifaecis]
MFDLDVQVGNIAKDGLEKISGNTSCINGCDIDN